MNTASLYLNSKENKINKKLNALILLLLFFCTLFYLSNNDNNRVVRAHNTNATPIEIFSFWNQTLIPTIDGSINFENFNNTSEWSPASLYSLVNNIGEIEGKIFLQNNDTHIFIALDVLEYQTELLPTTSGFCFYYDINHDGLLSNVDYSLRFHSNSTGDFVIVCQYSSVQDTWIEIEVGSPSTILPSSEILVDTFFGASNLLATEHRQYEISIPLSKLQKKTGEIIAFGIEVFEDYVNGDEELTWPFIGSNPNMLRTNAYLWGDLHIGKANENLKFVIEENLNLDANSFGENKGVFLTKGDIDGNGDFELIASSNDSSTTEGKKLAIYDYHSNEIVPIWQSWTTAHTIDFVIKGVATGDFNEDGKDEIYCVGEDSRILRFADWHIDDFNTSDIVYSHSRGLMGYIW